MLLRHLLKSFKISCLMILLALAFLWMFVKLIIYFYWAPFYIFTKKMKEWKEFWEVNNVLAISGSALALGWSFSTHNRIRNQCTSQEISKPMYESYIQWNKFLVLSNKKFCDFHGRYYLFIVYNPSQKLTWPSYTYMLCVEKYITKNF